MFGIVSLHGYVYVCSRMFTYVYIYIYLYVYIYVCVCMSTCMHMDVVSTVISVADSNQDVQDILD